MTLGAVSVMYGVLPYRRVLSWWSTVQYRYVLFSGGAVEQCIVK